MTNYVVLRKVRVVTLEDDDEPHPRELAAWEEVGRADAGGTRQAIRAVAATLDERGEDIDGEYVAVPARSFVTEKIGLSVTFS